MRRISATAVKVGDVIRHYGEQLKVESIEPVEGESEPLIDFYCSGAGYHCTVTLSIHENVDRL